MVVKHEPLAGAMELFVRQSQSLQCLLDAPSGGCRVASEGLRKAMQVSADEVEFKVMLLPECAMADT